MDVRFVILTLLLITATVNAQIVIFPKDVVTPPEACAICGTLVATAVLLRPTVPSTITYKSRAIACENGVLYLDCPSPSTILVSEAIYGRTEGPSVCPYTTPPLTTDCQSTTSDAIVKAACNGLDRCEISVTSAALGGDPCDGTYKYLYVKYQCV